MALAGRGPVEFVVEVDVKGGGRSPRPSMMTNHLCMAMDDGRWTVDDDDERQRATTSERRVISSSLESERERSGAEGGGSVDI